MDHKIKWEIVFCGIILTLGFYVDNYSAAPLDINKPATLSYANVLRESKDNNPAAQHVLGMSYLYGNTTYNLSKNINKAKEWLKKSADNAYPASAYEYAQLLADTNTKDAEKYYVLAISKGFTPALFSLAQLKIREGTPASIKEGLGLLAYAAGTAKDPLARAYLATLQYEGAGITKNRVDAILGMQKAVATAPTPETRSDWEEKQKKWTATLTPKEQDTLTDQLMMDSFDSSDASTEKGNAVTAPIDISALLSNIPINSKKATPK